MCNLAINTNKPEEFPLWGEQTAKNFITATIPYNSLRQYFFCVLIQFKLRIDIRIPVFEFFLTSMFTSSDHTTFLNCSLSNQNNFCL